jgi:hypothetical protein
MCSIWVILRRNIIKQHLGIIIFCNILKGLENLQNNKSIIIPVPSFQYHHSSNIIPVIRKQGLEIFYYNNNTPCEVSRIVTYDTSGKEMPEIFF